ncbi:hypothetical protein EC988_003357, partial [Linderina pennispora]
DKSIGFGALPGDEAGFDRTSPAAQAADAASRRVISDRIKNLANRFSQSNLGEAAETSEALPLTTPVIARRHSNSPSVSERVSLFDGSSQGAKDARSIAALFGKFGDASAASPGGRHSRASSVAGGSVRQRAETLEAGPETSSQASVPESSGEHADKPSELEGAESFPYRVPHVDTPGGSSFASDLSDEGLYRSRLKAMTSEPTATIAAGVQVSFTQSQGSLGAEKETQAALRGLRSDGLSKRRGSVHTAFGEPDSLRIVTDPVAISDAYRGVSPRTSIGAKLATEAGRSRSSSAANSPSGTFSSRHGSFRRPGSVVANARPSSAALAELGRQRALSQTSEAAEDEPAELDLQTDQSLFGALVQALGTRSFDRLDPALSTAAGGSIHSAAGSVAAVLLHMGSGKILAQADYERYVREVPAAKSRLQSARTRLALEMRMRDSAKSLAELHKNGGMFKAKNQQHAEELSSANARVQQVEVEISDLSTKLRLMESGLHDHQGAVLAAALRSLVGDAARIEDGARGYAQRMSERCASLEQQLAGLRLSHRSERDRLTSEAAQAQRALEEQVRVLQQRCVARETDDSDPETPLTRHSANRAVERLTGEVAVLREHKSDAEQRARALEARLDDALLQKQEMQQQLTDLRAQAAEMAEAAQHSLEQARGRADKGWQCVEAFASGIAAAVPALREIRALHQGSLPTPSDDDAGSTLPASPVMSLKFVDAGVSIDALEKPTADSWDAPAATGAMQLLTAAVGGCAGLYSESLKLHETNMQLLMDLGTEKRLREAQGLAIAQQREKLTRASETSERRIDETTKDLAAKHDKAKSAWDEERQRLLDNIERLSQDVKAMQDNAQIRALPVPSADSAVSSPAVIGSIEHVADHEQRIAGLQQDLELKTAETDSLQKQVAELEPLRMRCSELEDQLAQLQQGMKSAEPAAEPVLGDYVQKLKDANVLLASEPRTDEIGQVHEMYSLKLMAKEDALRNREDELEEIRASIGEIAATLQMALPSDTGSLPRSSPLRPASRTRTGFLQGLKSNYLGISPEVPAEPLHRAPSSQSLGTQQGIDGVPQQVAGLVPLAQAASTEVRRLKSLIYELDEQTRLARVELGDTQERYNNLKKHCQMRQIKEDSVQQDIAHVLAQISRMRDKVLRAERDKARLEKEVGELWARCLRAEEQTAGEVVEQISGRLGSAEWAKRPEEHVPRPSKFAQLTAIP